MMDSRESKLVIRQSEEEGFAPANHSGTTNRRLIGMETVGARKFEVLAGTIQRGHGAELHAHPDLEQLGYIRRGSGISEVNGKFATVTAGTWFYLPRGVFHRFTVGSDEPVELIVIYAPPYNEDPSHTVRAAGVVPDPAVGPHHLPLTCPAPSACTTELAPIITRSTVKAEYVEVHRLTVWPGQPLQLPLAGDAERALCLEHGRLRADVGEETVDAGPGDWVFVPPGRPLRAVAQGGQPAIGFVVWSVA